MGYVPVRKRTRLEALQLCLELWEWLAETGSSDKADWPGWERLGYTDIQRYKIHKCFACEYGKSRVQGCEKCILPDHLCNNEFSIWKLWVNADLVVANKDAANLMVHGIKEAILNTCQVCEDAVGVHKVDDKLLCNGCYADRVDRDYEMVREQEFKLEGGGE